MRKDKLRVGVLLDGLELAAWSHRMVAIITQSDYAEIALIVLNAAPASTLEPGMAMGTDKDAASVGLWGALANQILGAFERRLLHKPGYLPDALKTTDARQLLAGVEVLSVVPRRHGMFDYIEGDALDAIKARGIDVFIRLGFRILRGEILRSTRYGVWSCTVGGSRGDGRRPAGNREVLESQPVTESTLRILTDDPARGRIIYRSFSSTHDMSLADNQSNVLWKTLHFIPRMLKRLHQERDDTLLAGSWEEDALPGLQGDRLKEPLTNARRSILLWNKVLQKFRRKWEDTLFVSQWFLLYRFDESMSTEFSRFQPITPPMDRFWADPFIVARDNMYYIFIEEYSHAAQRGHISYILLHKDGRWEPPVRVLETPYHLSYPFIFEFAGEVYMVPESRANRTVELYKCTAFPGKWKFQKNLMENCQAVDPTLIHWQGKWWMFVNQVETEGASLWDEMFIYWSDSPLSSRWTPHRRNPVVSDTRSARPAGRLFVRDNRLYRPSQNCSGHYGYGFNICEVTTLTETEYEERIVSRVEPNWEKNIVSTHTVNFEGGLTVIDGQLLRRR